ncbi:hypothetical protein CEXT_409281 [Caerostris extrusa]|uniref:Uncharacterized protein n=1 Tax=Caerostris extrusa TaxID=172846 RepID=A0AAV4SJY0_CAEEX|nr:hypothetical protein CEXT_409281 [Caerostris extrusa]
MKRVCLLYENEFHYIFSFAIKHPTTTNIPGRQRVHTTPAYEPKPRLDIQVFHPSYVKQNVEFSRYSPKKKKKKEKKERRLRNEKEKVFTLRESGTETFPIEIKAEGHISFRFDIMQTF